MPFNAIVHAPALRLGARLNIAEADQTESTQPCVLTIGAEVRLRIGVCAPELVSGTVIGCTAESERVDPTLVDSTVDLVVGGTIWRLQRSERGGVTAPGLVSDAWYVVAAVDAMSSPVDHSRAYSPDDAAVKD